MTRAAPVSETPAALRARRRKPKFTLEGKAVGIANPGVADKTTVPTPVPKPRAHNHYIHHSAHPERMIVIAPQGTRDLHAAFLRLAITVRETGKPKSLWTYAPGISSGRISEDWDRFIEVVQPSVARDLSLVALAGQDIIVIEPRRLRSDALETEARSFLPTLGYPRPRVAQEANRPPTQKDFDVWKVLLAAWLQKEGPLTAQEIGRRANASSPTLRSTFARLRLRGEIADTRNRPIELTGFPRATLREVLALSGSLRRPFYFVDGSGRPADPDGLLRRLAAEQPSGVAVGGVVAARAYDPNFDLNGIPRLDLVVNSTDQVGWLNRLNPGLRLVDSVTPSPALVLHPVPHLRIGAATWGNGKLPLADPAETLLDLYELRLTEQAEDFVTRIRERGAR